MADINDWNTQSKVTYGGEREMWVETQLTPKLPLKIKHGLTVQSMNFIVLLLQIVFGLRQISLGQRKDCLQWHKSAVCTLLSKQPGEGTEYQ